MWRITYTDKESGETTHKLLTWTEANAIEWTKHIARQQGRTATCERIDTAGLTHVVTVTPEET